MCPQITKQALVIWPGAQGSDFLGLYVFMNGLLEWFSKLYLFLNLCWNDHRASVRASPIHPRPCRPQPGLCCGRPDCGIFHLPR